MPAPVNTYRVVVSGKMAGGETWSNSWWVQGDAPASNAAAQAEADIWWTVCVEDTDPSPYNLMSTTYWSAPTTVEKVTVYSYPTGGNIATYIGEHVDEVIGAHSSAMEPNQVAIVVSLRTAVAGRRARGRIYMPCTYMGIGETGQFGSAACNAIATSWAHMINKFQESQSGKTVVVVSQTATQFHPITTVIVDTRPDVQRRRARKQAPESTEIVAVAGA